MQPIQEIQMHKMRANCQKNANKKLKLLRAFNYAKGSKQKMLPEARLDSLSFTVHKFNNRKKPTNPNKILIIPAFYEFGTETIGVTYCIPQIIHRNPDCYVIVAGWHGRKYFYSKLADEYWELKEDYQWLREYADAFYNDSRNLLRLELKLSNMGKIADRGVMAKLCVEYYCISCSHYFFSNNHIDTLCPKCNTTNLSKPLFGDIQGSRKKLWQIPEPNKDKINFCKNFLKPKSVGIFARNRLRYGRNLSINFYVKLINLLRELGYNPVWLGEKQSVYSCPDPTILDFTNKELSKDLEMTLAIISQCDFTIQFYTASTRLASMVKTPWILFESTDQLVGGGQEGMRIAITTEYDKKKIVVINFQSLYEDENLGIKLCRQSISELENKNFETIVGVPENKDIIESGLQKFNRWWR